MIRPLTFDEEIDMLPPLTPEEQAVCDSIDINAVVEKAFAMLSPEQIPKWHVVDDRDGSIKRFVDRDSAFIDAAERNLAAKHLGISARYHVRRCVCPPEKALPQSSTPQTCRRSTGADNA